MATIPRYTSKETLTKEAPVGYMKPETYGVMQDPAQAAQTSIGATMQDISQVISNVNEKIKKVKNANATSKANIVTTSDFATYTEEFLKNPDINHSLDDIDNKIADTRNKNAELFDDSIAREEYQRAYDLNALKFKLDLRTQQMKRQVDMGRANILTEIDQELSNYVNAQNSQDKIASRTRVESIMQRGKELQLFGQEEGDKVLNRMIDSADEATKDVEALKKRREKEIALLLEQAKNEREDELVQMRVNNQTPLEELIKMARRDMNEGRIDPKFAEAYINACKTPKLEKPSSLESAVKYNELVEREAALSKKESAWFGIGKVPFEDLAQFRADVFDARANGHITDAQLKALLASQSKTFYRDPVFQNALQQLAAHSSLYSTPAEQARIKSEMYGSLITKVINGTPPRDAVAEVIKERIDSEMGAAVEVIKKDNRVFASKGKQRIYSEDGGITWKDVKTNEVVK